jgi:TRAP-type mannitol/chloroaromatic compound transport system permease small subunit
VQQSRAIRERSPQADGLPGIFLLKSALLACYALLTLQGFALAARCWLVLRGRTEFAPPLAGHCEPDPKLS